MKGFACARERQRKRFEYKLHYDDNTFERHKYLNILQKKKKKTTNLFTETVYHTVTMVSRKPVAVLYFIRLCIIIIIIL